MIPNTVLLIWITKKIRLLIILVINGNLKSLRVPTVFFQIVKFSLNTWGQTREVIEGSFYLLKDPVALFYLCVTSLASVGGYLTVGAVFGAFVVANGGVAVGDKMAHAVTFHPTQVCIDDENVFSFEETSRSFIQCCCSMRIR